MRFIITPILKKEIEKAASEWNVHMHNPLPIQNPFVITNNNDVEKMFNILCDKLNDCCYKDVEKLLCPYCCKDINPEQINNYYGEYGTEGKLMDSLNKHFNIPFEILRDLHVYSLQQALINNADSTMLRFAIRMNPGGVADYLDPAEYLSPAIKLAVTYKRTDYDFVNDNLFYSRIVAKYLCDNWGRVAHNAEIQNILKGFWKFNHDAYCKLCNQDITLENNLPTSIEPLQVFINGKETGEIMEKASHFLLIKNRIKEYIRPLNNNDLRTLTTLFSVYTDALKLYHQQFPNDDDFSICVRTPNIKIRNAIAILLGYPNWESYCSEEEPSNGRPFSDIHDAPIENDAIFVNGNITKFVLTDNDDNENNVNLFLRCTDATKCTFEVVSIDGYINNLNQGDILHIGNIYFDEALTFLKKDDPHETNAQILDKQLMVEDAEVIQPIKRPDSTEKPDAYSDWVDILKRETVARMKCELGQEDNTIGREAASEYFGRKGFEISAATVRRILGGSDHLGILADGEAESVPSDATLDIFARSIGYQSFEDYVIKNFLHARLLHKAPSFALNDMPVGQRYQVEYMPNRQLTFIVISRPNGEKACQILTINNSRNLQKGDVFQFREMEIMQPIHFTSLQRGEQHLGAYQGQPVTSVVAS
jgi:hypothetical protein